MSLTPSTMRDLGSPAPDFALPSTEDRVVSLSDFKDAKALLVIFLCNHCPYVKHVQHGLAALCREYRPRGVGIVGISSNDVSRYPDDGPEMMKKEKERIGYPFPYLYDETQEVARAYHAACTPDFFLYDGRRRLAYRGQMDDSRPNNGKPVTGRDLRAALDAVLEGKPAPSDQKPSMGCNIKWKPGNEPSFRAST